MLKYVVHRGPGVRILTFFVDNRPKAAANIPRAFGQYKRYLTKQV